MNRKEDTHACLARKEHSLELKLSHILLYSHKERKKENKGKKYWNGGKENTHTHTEKGLVALSLQVGWV